MVKHLDIDGNILEKAIYRSKSSKNLFYFTGRYNKYEDACFENIEGETVELPIDSSALLRKLKNKEIDKIINWLEKGLKE
jgi:hypothetical protein